MIESNPNINTNKKIEAILKKQSLILTKVKWSGMYPFLVEDKDSILLEVSSEPFKKYDVILYKSIGGNILLKRIFEIKSDYLFIAGDNETTCEKINKSQAIAKMKSYYKDGKETLKDNINYLKYLKGLKCRRSILKLKNKFKSIFKW